MLQQGKNGPGNYPAFPFMAASNSTALDTCPPFVHAIAGQ